ncbi:hypothetical protein BJV74DRAFT_853520 [Russula compacta]|nr:hypothetical protein BJV74DRAFT_853520 [Russula compacta]
MASLSVPPSTGPTPTRLDWANTPEHRRDRSRGGRGGRRGATSSRGERSHGSPPTEKGTNTPTPDLVPTQPAPSMVSPPSHTSTTSKNSSSPSQPPPGVGVDLKEKRKAGPRRAPQHAEDKLPSLTIQPASPTVTSFGSAPHSAPTTTFRPSTRRRRSHNKPLGATISSENLTVESLTSAMKARKSSSGPSSPRPKDSVSKNAPPHSSVNPTVESFSTKTTIDSLVEHVRALAMDHRPSTPGSHIDWADEDDSLPDLDDWGVPPRSIASADPNPSTTESTEKAQLELMSPILDDSLKQLPHGFDKTTPSPSVGSGSLSPNIANQAPVLAVNGELDDEDAAGVAGALSSSSPVGSDQPEDQSPGLSEPSPQSGPVSSPPPERVLASNTGPPRDTPPHLAGPSSEDSAPASSVTPLIQSGRSLADSIHAPHRAAHAPSEAHATQSEVDISIGVSAESVHASAPKSDESESGPPEGPRSAPLPRAPMHGRSHTLGRPSPFSAGAKRGFFSGSSTQAGVGVTAAKGPHHGRTQSSPVTHRRQQSRPVITMDAMTRLAKTLGTALPKREVAGTSSATSSE